MERITPQYYTFQETLVALGICDATLRNYIKQGKIPYKQYGRGGKILIPKSAVDYNDNNQKGEHL